MCISFQNTRFSNPKPASTLRNAINTADLQYSCYSEKTIKLKEEKVRTLDVQTKARNCTCQIISYIFL